MSIRISALALALAAVALGGRTAGAATYYVNCATHDGLNTIGAAVRAAKASELREPATINVTGACRENVQITDIDRLTLNGLHGASVTDASNGAIETIGVYRGTGITIAGLTVNGGADAISVGGASVVLSAITAQGAVSDGVGVYPGGFVFINVATLQNNGYAGLLVFGGDANAAGVTTQGNAEGIVVDRGGRMQFRVTDPFYEGGSASVPAVVTRNSDFGILAQNNSEAKCLSCAITSNASGGVSLDMGSNAVFGRYYLASGVAEAPLTITGNGGPGIIIGDLSSAAMPFSAGAGLVQGNGGAFQIACNSATSATRRALLFASGVTNCVN